MVEQAGHHCRDAPPAGDALLLDQAKDVRRVEAPLQEYEPAAGEERDEKGLEAGEVEERNGQQRDGRRGVERDVGRESATEGQHVLLTGDDRPVRQRRPLGPTRRSRGEEDDRRIVLVDHGEGELPGAGPVDQRPEVVERPSRGGGREQRPASVVRQRDDGLHGRYGVMAFLFAPPAVAGNHHAAEAERRPEGHNPLWPVGAEEQDSLPAADTECLQPGGHRPDGLLMVGEGNAAPAVHEVVPSAEALPVQQQFAGGPVPVPVGEARMAPDDRSLDFRAPVRQRRRRRDNPAGVHERPIRRARTRRWCKGSPKSS